MLRPHVHVLAVDGLRASALGAYGGAGATPAIDRLASQSTVFDWLLADAPELPRVYEALGRGVASVAGPGGGLWSPTTHRSELLTDTPEVAELPFAGSFESASVVPRPAFDRPATGLAETWLTAVVGEFAERVAVLCGDADDRPVFTWAHTQGFYGPWDAPVESVAALLDEDDPPLDTDTEPAVGVVTEDAPDEAFVASCRYAAQVAVLDACVDGLLAAVDGASPRRPSLFVLMGVRGYALGEHGVIGGDDRRLFAETLHTPLLLRGGADAQQRGGRPLGSRHLPTLLASAAAGELAWPPAEPIVQTAATGAAAVLDDGWRLIRPAEGESRLFVKPDDRWEVNDIASLLPDEVERLEALLAPPSFALARPENDG